MLIKASNRAKYEKGEEKIMERAFVVYRNAIMRLNSVARKCSKSKATLKRRIDGTNVNGVGHKKNFDRIADFQNEVKMTDIFHPLTKHTVCFHYYLY
jgi:hypothetical protein